MLEPQPSLQATLQILNPIRAAAAWFLAKRPFALAQRKQSRSQFEELWWAEVLSATFSNGWKCSFYWGRASTGTNALQCIIPSRVRWPVKLIFAGA